MSNSNIDRCKVVVNEMMNDRGYNYSSNDDNTLIYTREDKKRNTVIIFIDKKEDIKVKQVEKYKKTYDQDMYDIILIVTFISIEEKLLSKYMDLEYNNMQVFHIKDLLYNITKHKYVPKHSILNEEEKKQFTELYKITDIAKIKISDPVCRYHFAKIGNIMKITRLSNNSKEEINYRLCI
tara:strand:+ start:191 stop:730 length:540 start_codon:yes stop_codon:yes gene_type:complete